MTVREFILKCIERLSPLYVEKEARAVAFRLLEHFTDIPSYKYISEPEMDLPADEARSGSGILLALDELATGRPLQYVLGFAEFYGHRFKVGEACLIPRPETEELVSRIIDELYSEDGDARQASDDDSPFSILDLCTGSGCIAWSLAAEFPEAMVYGCDISDDALRYACRQRIKLRGAKPIFFHADVFAEPPAGLPKFDVIVSNPPYICESEKIAMRRNVLGFEPAEALFVPDDDPLRFYKAIKVWAGVLLRPGGHIYLEINERFGPDVAALFPGSRVLRDISGRDRFIFL